MITPTQDSDNFGPKLMIVFIALLFAGFVIPQESLNNNELLLLWVVITFAAWLWIQSDRDGIRDY